KATGKRRRKQRTKGTTDAGAYGTTDGTDATCNQEFTKIPRLPVCGSVNRGRGPETNGAGDRHGCEYRTNRDEFPTVRIQRHERTSGDVGIGIHVRSDPMNRHRIRAHPLPKPKRQVACSEVGQADLDVLFLAGELVGLADAAPALGAVVALGRAVGLVGRVLDELARGVVDDEAVRAEVVVQEQEDVAATAHERRK